MLRIFQNEMIKGRHCSSGLETIPIYSHYVQYANANFENVYIPSPAGTYSAERVHAWWIPADQSPNWRVLLYLPGSAFNISANVEHARRFHRLGFSLLLISYRGDGISDGDGPSEKTMYEDAAAFDFAVENRSQIPCTCSLYITKF